MTYPGGKNGSGVYQQIINQFPPHRLYVEPFLGSGAIMRLKRPAIANIAIDADAAAIAAFPAGTVPGLSLINGDALAWLSSADLPRDALIYLDPPYLMTTRSSQRKIYNVEFSDTGQHKALLEIIIRMPCMVAISGYYSDLYADLLQGWRSIHFQAMTHSGPATEWLWMNYPAPVELHDYRYLGSDYRERERIKRKKQRWSKRLELMDPLERLAVMAAIDDLRSTAHTVRSGVVDQVKPPATSSIMVV